MNNELPPRKPSKSERKRAWKERVAQEFSHSGEDGQPAEVGLWAVLFYWLLSLLLILPFFVRSKAALDDNGANHPVYYLFVLFVFLGALFKTWVYHQKNKAYRAWKKENDLD